VTRILERTNSAIVFAADELEPNGLGESSGFRCSTGFARYCRGD